MKALGVGLGAFALRDVEVRHRAGRLALARAAWAGAQLRADELGVESVEVSLTHTGVARRGRRRGRVHLVKPVVTVRGDARRRRRRDADRHHDTLVERAGLAVALGAVRLLPRVYGARVIVAVRSGIERRRRPGRGTPPRARAARWSSVLDATAPPARSTGRPRHRRGVRHRAVEALRRTRGRRTGPGPRRRRALGRRSGHRTRRRAARCVRRRPSRWARASGATCWPTAPSSPARSPSRRSGSRSTTPRHGWSRTPTSRSCRRSRARTTSGDAPSWSSRAPRRARRRRPRVRRRTQRAGRHGAAVLPGRLAPQRGTVAPEVVRLAASADDAEKVVLDALERARALVMGPGLGRSAKLQRTVTELLRATREPVVLDADALHLVDVGHAARTPVARRQPGRTHPARRRVRRDVRRAAGHGPLRRRPRRRIAHGLHGRAQGRDHGGRLVAAAGGTARDARRDVGHAGPRDAWHGRRARRDHRWAARAGRAGPPRRRARRPRARTRRRLARRDAVVPSLLAEAVAAFLAARRTGEVTACRLRGGAVRRGPRSTSPRSRATRRRSRPLSRPPRCARSSRRTATATARGPSRRTLLEAGATSLGVALVDEGIELRDDGIDAPILLLSEAPATALRDAIDARLTLTVGSLRGARDVVRAAAPRSPARARPREGRHRHAPPGRRAVGTRRGARRPRRTATCRSGGCGRTSRSPTAPPTRRSSSPPPSSSAFLRRLDKVRPRLGADARAATPRTPRAPSRSPRARLDLVRVGLGLYGYLPNPALGRRARRRAASRPRPRALAQGARHRGARPRSRGAPELRAAARAPGRRSGRDGADRLRRRRARARSSTRARRC